MSRPLHRADRFVRRRSSRTEFRRRFFRPLVEWLEDRRVLSVFYDLEVIAQTGEQTSTGETINSIDPSVSINDNGRVAFVADVSGASGAGSAVLADDGATATMLISFPNPTSIRTFAFPQINNAGLVAARDRVSTLSDSFIRTWDSNNPGQFTVVAGTNQAAGDTFDSVTLPTLGNDGGVGFIGLTNGSTQSDLYYNPSGVRFEDQAVLDVTGSGGLRPMISNEGTLVVRKGSGTTGEIVVLSASGAATIASATSGFTSLGAAPGISDDGDLVAFAGDRGNGPGIFLGFLDSARTSLILLETVAGETAAAGSNNELGYDAAGNALFLNAFDIDSRIGVSRQALGPAGLEGDSIILSFIATPNAASRQNPAAAGPLLFSDQSGLWTVQVDIARQLVAPNGLRTHIKSPIPVVQLGDTIAGQSVTGISVYDPIAVAATTAAGTPRTPRFGENRLAFLASTAGGSMVVRASQLDSDEDGLFDHWERAGGGIDMDQDGTIDLDLNAMGASVTQRDLFLEIDWMNPRVSGGSSPWKNEPPPGNPAFVPSATQFVVNTFAAAPALANGIPAGITVHLDAGTGEDALGNDFSQNMGTGPRQGGDQIGQAGTGAHLDMVHFGLPGSVAVSGLKSRSFGEIKDIFFGTADKRARELAFRYVVLADFHDFQKDAAGNMITGDVDFALRNALVSTTDLPALAPDNKYNGAAVLITAGTGAGQVRTIMRTAPGFPDQLNLRDDWSVFPDATSKFVILTGSSGRGEVDFYRSPDFYSVPGNDLIVSMGAFGVNNQILSNSFDTGRTIVHELGHTLGLRHGGVDHDAHKGLNYLSLMSYDHQLDPMSAVNSYSFARDPTFDDWSNLKLGFQNTLVHVGNTFGLGLGDSAPPEDRPALNPAEVEEINNAPLDFDSPNVVLQSPAPSAVVEINDAFAVEIAATDASGIAGVEVRFDISGDGDAADAGETVIAALTSTGTYRATFDSLSGPTGPRTIRVVALDALGNFQIVDRNVQVTGVVVGGPEVRVTGNGLTIVDAAASTSAADGTDFGAIYQGQPAPERIFTVENTGVTTLSLGAVNLPAGFVLVEPLAATLSPGQTDSFTLKLDNSAIGTFTGGVSFATNDTNENPFSFAVLGTVLTPAPEIEVSGNGQNILDGDGTPAAFDHTDFGLAPQNQSGPARVFTVRNIGVLDLTPGSVSLPAGFTLVEPLAASLAPGASDTFSVQLGTATLGVFGGLVSFTTNDPNENPFQFSIQGSVAVAPGSLDLTFGGGDGKVTTHFSHDIVGGVIVQPDGKILVGGSTDHINLGFMVARYRPDGSPDTAFGGGDGVVLEGVGLSGQGKVLLLQPDGKIMLIGYAATLAGPGVGLLRLNSDGSLDTSFGANGKVIRLIGSIFVNEGGASLQPDGKIVIVGRNSNSGNNDFAVARLNANGTVDTSFGGGDGVTISDFGSTGNDGARAVEIDASGRIVVAGVANGGDWGLARYTSAGTLDITFGGGDGQVITDFGGFAEVANDVALQPDGRIVVVGLGGSPRGVSVARYNSDGTLDTAFGGDGLVFVDVGEGEEPKGVVLQPDGKILVAGSPNILLTRLNSDGSLDAAFGLGGSARTDFLGVGESAEAIALQPDGKIVVAGIGGSQATSADFLVARFNNNLLDLPTVTMTAADAEGSETGPDGLRFTVARTGPTAEPLTIRFELQNNGVAGQATLGADFTIDPASLQVTIPAGSSTAEIVLAVLTDAVDEEDELVTLAILFSPEYYINLPYIGDGVIRGECAGVDFQGDLDSTFGGGDGFVATDFEVGFTFSSSLALQPDGKVLVAARLGGQETVAIARYRMNGIPDPSFDNDGLVIVSSLGIYFNMRPLVGVQSDGKILAVGTSPDSGFGLVRLEANGSVDATFGGGDGLASAKISPFVDLVNAMLIQPDGKILLAGQSSNLDTGNDFSVARFNADGTLDTTFGGGDGLVTTHIGPGDAILDLALQPDGKIVAVGSTAYNGPFFTGSDWALARYNPDGTLDTTFGGTGIVTTSIHDSDTALSVALRPDGKIVVAGSAIISNPIGSNEAEAVLAQYNADGTLDATFGGGDGLVLERFVKLSASIDGASSVVIQPDGKIIIIGNDDSKLALVRYRSDGTRDASFGGGGVVVTGGSAPFNGHIDAALQPDGKLVVTVQGSSGGATNTGFNLTRFTGPCLSDVVLASNLEVTVTGESAAVAGGNASYTIIVTNSGSAAASDVVFTDLLPENTTFVSFVAPAGWTKTTPAVGGTGTATASISSLAGGETANFTLIVRVNANTPDGATLTNTTSAATTTLDSNPANNTDTETTAVVAVADLSITASGSPDPVAAGQHLTYAITVTNRGVSDAQDIALSDAIPANTTFVSLTAPAGWTNTAPSVGGTGTVASTNPALAAGAAASFTLIVRVAPTASGGSVITNTASVTTTTTETDAANNTATDTADVTRAVLQDCDVFTLNVAGSAGTATRANDGDNPGSGVIIVTGTSKNDVIIIERRPVDPSQIRVKINGQVKGIYNSSDVRRIVAFGLNGNDTIIVGWNLEQDAVLFGDAGNDSLYGGAGKDGLDGGTGNDRLFGGWDEDMLCGGDGNDFLYGQQNNDFLHGDAGNDKLYGEGGDDQLQGGNGHDYLYGGIGNDRLFGQVGNDILFGESGNDIVVGGAGNDHLFGGVGRDLLIGSTGDDTLYGEGDDDILVANSTIYDTDEIALMAILLEWTSSNSYTKRVNNIRFGSGANGAFTLDNATLLDDGRPDTVWGHGGQDWFLTVVTDRIRDKEANDQGK